MRVASFQFHNSIPKNVFFFIHKSPIEQIRSYFIFELVFRHWQTSPVNFASVVRHFDRTTFGESDKKILRIAIVRIAKFERSFVWMSELFLFVSFELSHFHVRKFPLVASFSPRQNVSLK